MLILLRASASLACYCERYAVLVFFIYTLRVLLRAPGAPLRLKPSRITHLIDFSERHAVLIFFIYTLRVLLWAPHTLAGFVA